MQVRRPACVCAVTASLLYGLLLLALFLLNDCCKYSTQEPLCTHVLGSHITTTDHLQQLGSKLYLYKAYYDERLSKNHTGTWSVRILAMAQRAHTNSTFMCLLWTDQHPMVIPATIQVIWENQATYQAAVITCVLPGDVTVSHVSVAEGCEVPDNILTVQQYRKSPAGLGLCNKVLYSQPDPVRLVEWIELNLMLGVDTIYMYNSSVEGPSNAVLRYYVTRGVIRLTQHNFPQHVSTAISGHSFPSPDYNQNWQLELMSLNDCLYSAQQQQLLVIDIDEILYAVSGFRTLLQRDGFVLHNNTAGLTFFTTVFSDEFGVDNSSNAPWYLHTMTHRIRTRLDWESPKSVVHALRCVGLGHHICLLPLPGYLHRTNLAAQSGYVRHYRTTCRLTGEPHKCDKLLRQPYIDKALTPYSQELNNRVLPVLKVLQLL